MFTHDFRSTSDREVAIGIANPPTAQTAWKTVEQQTDPIHFSVDDYPAQHGETFIEIGRVPGIFGTVAVVVLCYDRNNMVENCAENSALSGHGDPLDPAITDEIVSHHATDAKPDFETTYHFETLEDGSYSVTRLGAKALGIEGISASAHFPAVLLTSLRSTHCILGVNTLYLVTLQGEDDTTRVFKEASDWAPPSLSFFASIPPSDALLPPTHVVLDANGAMRGFLLDYHPAGSLNHILGAGQTVPWTVKIVWCLDITAGLAFLHSQDCAWGDLKTDNIILCKDGRCRLIDYEPQGWTRPWCPRISEMNVGPTDDVYSLGLVLWCVAMDLGRLPWDVPYDIDTGPNDIPPEERAKIIADSWSNAIPDAFRAVVEAATSLSEAERPTASSIYTSLAGI